MRPSFKNERVLAVVAHPDDAKLLCAGTLARAEMILDTLILAHASEDYHPDHRAAAALAEAVSWFCASRGHRTHSSAMSAPPAFWWMDTIGMSEFEPGFYVDISEFVNLKTKMLACYQSQLTRGTDTDFSPLLEVMRVQLRARGMQAGVEAAEAFRSHIVFKRGRAW